MRWLALVLMIAGGGVCQGVTWAQESETIPVVAGFADHAALTDGLQRRIQAAVCRRLEARSSGQVEWTAMPAEWKQQRGEGLRPRVTAGMCRQLKLDRGIQALVLWVDYTRGAYHLSCAVFHREFDDVILSRSVAVVDRRIVVNHADRLVQRVWRSVGEIVESRANSLVISLGVARGGSSGSLPRLGLPLEVVRVARTPDGNRRQAWVGHFLVVSGNQDASAVEAKIIDGDGRVPDFFRHLRDSRVRFFVRSMKPRSGPTRIQVVRASNGRPREACAVYVSSEKPTGKFSDGLPDGLTDAAGLYVVPFQTRGFRFVTVVCGFRRTTRPIASGQGDVPIVITLPRNTPQKQREAFRDRVQRRINEVNEWVNVITRKLNQSTTDRDEVAIRDAIVVLERDPGWRPIRRDLEEFNRSGVNNGEDRLDEFAQQALDRLRESERDWRVKIASYKTSLRSIKSDRLVGEYQAARDAFKWRDAVGALEKLAPLSVDPQPVRTRLARLKRALAEHSREHARARESARDHVRAESAADLLTVWSELETSVRVLIREDDAPVLWELAADLQKLVTLLDDDSKAITRKIQTSGDDLSDEALQRLTDRGKAIGKALMGLAAARKDSSKLIREFLF